jgi:hypothetical protein
MVVDGDQEQTMHYPLAQKLVSVAMRALRLSTVYQLKLFFLLLSMI